MNIEETKRNIDETLAELKKIASQFSKEADIPVDEIVATELAEAPIEEAPAEEPANTEIEDRITNLEAQIASILEMLNGLNGSTQTMMSKVIELSKQPAAKPLEFGKENINTNQNSEPSLDGIREKLKGIKK